MRYAIAAGLNVPAPSFNAYGQIDTPPRGCEAAHRLESPSTGSRADVGDGHVRPRADTVARPPGQPIASCRGLNRRPSSRPRTPHPDFVKRLIRKASLREEAPW